MSRSTTVLFVAFVLAALTMGQGDPLPMTRVPVELASGQLTNGTTDARTVWAEVLTIPTASSVQLVFEVADLGNDDDVLIVRGAENDEMQRLTRLVLKQWRNHSAWFNGSTVTLELQLSPGSSAQVAVGAAFAFLAPMAPPAGLDSLCGADDRVLSTDARVNRLVITSTQTGGGCTGWLINSRNVILSAGHCASPLPDYFVIAEFNYPLSNALGEIQHPGVADQFPVDQTTIQANNGGVGNDWAVARLHPNSSGETASQRQGGWFTLVTTLPIYAPPLLIPTFRVTGNGSDSTPNYTYNYVQQTSTGPSHGYSGDVVQHRVDTTDGGSGSPIIDVASGAVVGIHTNAGCDATPTSYNTGTSVLNAGLQAAIANASGCASLTLTNDAPASVTCTPVIFNTSAPTFDWAVVGVSSTNDWDIQIESTGSTYGGSACDYLIANGNLGGVAPVSGSLFRFAGLATATAEFQIATTITVGQQNFGSLASTEIVDLFQFLIPSAGSYDITVNGDPAFGFDLYAPGVNDAWRPRGGAGILASGTVGGQPHAAFVLSPGWHALLVGRNGGPGVVDPTALTVTVCTSLPTLALSQDAAVAVASDCRRFAVVPEAGWWNVVGITSASDWDIDLGPAQSQNGGAICDFVVANGTLGGIGPSLGVVARYNGTEGATVEHGSRATGALGVPHDTVLAAGDVVDIVQYTIAASGNYDLTVTGDGSLSFSLFVPGTSAEWRPRNARLWGGTVGDASQTFALGTGSHAVVISRNGGTSAAALPYTIHFAPTVAPLTLAPSTISTTVTTISQPFTISPSAGSWNAVGVTSTSDWDIAIGTAESQLGLSFCDFLVANGNLGSIAPTAGIITRFSGASTASANQATRVTVTPGTTYGAAWGASQALRVFEFTIPTANDYDIGLTGLSGLDWFLFEPGPDSAWRRRGDADFVGTVGGAGITRALGAGVHAIVVCVDGGVGISGSFTVDVHQTPYPVPVLTSMTPTVATAGAGAVSLACSGSAFVPASVVRWDGTSLPTTYLNSGSLSATLAAGFLTSAGTHSITVFTPTPGGGTSAGLTFTINNPVPTLASMSPTSATAGGAAFTLTVNGTNYNTQSRVQWNGVNLTTTLVSATQLTVAVPAANIATAGTATVRINNPAPGGGVSSSLTFTINNPVPTLASLSPASAIAGGAAFTLTANGTNCNTQTRVMWNGVALTTTFVSTTQVTAAVPAANIATAGSIIVRLNNPTPGGGSSGSLTFTVNNPVPTLASLSPTSQFAGGAAFTLTVNGTNFNAQSQVRWNSAALTTTLVSGTQLTAAVPAANIAFSGTASVDVRNPTPGGGVTAALTFTIVGPAVTSISPAAIAVMTPVSPPVVVTVNGSGFMSTSKVFANGIQLTTTYISGTQLTAQLPPAVPQTQFAGGLAVAVQNFPTVASNLAEIVVGTGSNHGVIGHVPLVEPIVAGSTFSLNMEGCTPSAPFLLVGDLGMPPPVTNWPTPAANFVLSVGTPGLFVVLDGIGVFGPPQAGVVMSPNQPGNTPPGGEFILSGLVAPLPSLGASFTLQVAYLDAASPTGFRLTWALVDTGI